MKIYCPNCNILAKLIDTRYGVRFTCTSCTRYSWGGKELVLPIVHEHRKKAHSVFDVLWKSGRLSRTEAYRILREHLGLTRKECHIALFDVERCQEVIKFAENYHETEKVGVRHGH